MREKYLSLSLGTLKELAKARGMKGISTLKKSELIERMLQEDEKDKKIEKEKKVEKEEILNTQPATKPEPRSDRPPMEQSELDSGICAKGILEVLPDGYGFIRSDNYLPGENDVYVSPSQIRRFNLKTGDILKGNTRVKSQNEKFSALLYVTSINVMKPNEMRRYNFEDMTPIFPNERLHFERPGGSVAMRVVDLVSPIGKGQRGMIVSPPNYGKTTMLNIIGGLDQYTSGDLKLNGRSTKKFKDRDWDAYRNNSIGFVFQSYNLIPHQTVLANVELALTLSGVSKSERRKRAIEALDKVGLKDQIHKKPNQMSGGQMQVVAIARALVNDPDILLADEPTGALDTETSVQIMAILKEIAKDRLIIMVTHNPELAEQYSTRIFRLLDGQITDDTDAYSEEQMKADIQEKEQKTHEYF